MNKITNLKRRKGVEIRPGLVKTNLSYNQDSMICHFVMKKGARIGLHNHKAVQNGYVVHGKLKYQVADSDYIILSEGVVEDGAGYIWDSMEVHSFEALEDSEFIEHFSPMRPEYIVDDDAREGDA
jgi:quercetin dioxygenase-like cupin family protein